MNLTDTSIKPKPAYGKPCNGCGVCCRASLCPMAKLMNLEMTPSGCPLMLTEHGSIQCGLFKLESVYLKAKPWEIPVVGLVLGSGNGCDCFIINYPPDDALTLAEREEHKIKQYIFNIGTNSFLGKHWGRECIPTKLVERADAYKSIYKESGLR